MTQLHAFCKTITSSFCPRLPASVVAAMPHGVALAVTGEAELPQQSDMYGVYRRATEYLAFVQDQAHALADPSVRHAACIDESSSESTSE